MLTLYDGGRRPMVLNQQIARGGQGVIYAVNGRPGLLGKVYVPRPEEGQDDKLRWMVAHPPPDPSAPDHASIAWPQDLLSDQAGRCLGYLMPYVQEAWPILRVFNPRSREQTLPGFSRRYLHRAALNLARALRSLHEHDYIVGDLNESNILVTRRAMVTVIDTDSFQVQEPRQSRIIVYPCPVGKPEYTAPELQGQAFRGVLRRPEHDAFALAVLIFQLLMEGNHPFRARWLGAGEPAPLAERIQRGYYPYDPVQSGLVEPAPGVPPISDLAPGLAGMFAQCFVEGHSQPARRPTAAEWEEVLAKTEYAAGASATVRHGTARPRAATGTMGGARSSGAGKQTTKAGPGGGSGGRSKSAGRAAPAQPSPVEIWAKQGLARLLQAWAQSQPQARQPTGSGGLMQALAQLAALFVSQGSAAPAPTMRQAGGPAASPPAAPPTVTCPRCGQANHPDEIYCQKCAFPLAGVRECPRCKHPMPRNSHYCTHCSSRV